MKRHSTSDITTEAEVITYSFLQTRNRNDCTFYRGTETSNKMCSSESVDTEERRLSVIIKHMLGSVLIHQNLIFKKH
jgi:hypothetical protein